MKQHEYAKLGRVLESTHPEIVKGLILQMSPELKNTAAIYPMYAKFKLDHNPDVDFKDRITFISSILKLYCPSALMLNCRVTDRVCIILTDVMGYNFKQSISYLIAQSRVYIKNPNFREVIERVSSELKEVA